MHKTTFVSCLCILTDHIWGNQEKESRSTIVALTSFFLSIPVSAPEGLLSTIRVYKDHIRYNQYGSRTKHFYSIYLWR